MNILLSIKPEYAKLIYEGNKTIEYRKDFPKFVLWGSKIFLYETAPIKRVTGFVYFNELKKIFRRYVKARAAALFTRYIGPRLRFLVFFAKIRPR